MKLLMIALMLAVLAALGAAGFAMLRQRKHDDDPEGRRMARALAWRVGLSVTLFLLILLGWGMGWVRPSGLPVSG